jgi:hypothetical protein
MKKFRKAPFHKDVEVKRELVLAHFMVALLAFALFMLLNISTMHNVRLEPTITAIVGVLLLVVVIISVGVILVLLTTKKRR